MRGVWARHDLRILHQRRLRLEETVRKHRIKLTAEQIQALKRFDLKCRGALHQSRCHG